MDPPQAVSSTPTGDWRLYSPPDKSFSVELPCEPTQTNVSEPSTPSYEYSCGSEDAGGLRFFLIAVSKADSEGAKPRDEAAFERTVKGMFPPNRRIVKIVPIKIDGGIGREIIITNTRDDMDNLRGRVIMFGSHLFAVGYVATDIKLLESPEADRFLAAFKPFR